MRVRVGIGGPVPDTGRWIVVMEVVMSSGEAITHVGPLDYENEEAAMAAAMIVNARVGNLPGAVRQSAACPMCEGNGVMEVGTGKPPDRIGVHDSDEIPCPICADDPPGFTTLTEEGGGIS